MIVLSTIIATVLFLSGCITESCHTYTIYPFPDRPNDSTSPIGVYIHASNEPTGCGAAIAYAVMRFYDTFTITLGESVYSEICPTVVGADEAIPNARIILGELGLGTYNIQVKTCGHIDRYLLYVEEQKLRLEPVEVRYGALSNDGIYEFKEMVEPTEPVCNNNGVCEIDLGEHIVGCDSDCRCGDDICDSMERQIRCRDCVE